MKKVKMLAVAAAAMVCAACAVGNGAGGEFVIASGGHVKCTIVSNGHDGPARELAKYLGRIVGGVVPVVSRRSRGS